MRLIMKFGGSCLADGRQIQYASQIVKNSLTARNQVVVIVSAIGDTTDELVEACEKSAKGDLKFIQMFADRLQSKHLKIIRDCVKSRKIRTEVINHTKSLVTELANVLNGIVYLGELTPRVRDHAYSFGERLSASIFWGCLSSTGVSSRWLSGKDAGIITDSNYGQANPLLSMIQFNVKQTIVPLLKKGITPVVTGFIGADQRGIITTLGRGGSDYSATILGSVLQANEIWMWTDVDGIMNADPRVVHSAETISEISFPEAMEMAYFGAKMMHPRAFEAAMQSAIPVRIKNLFNFKNAGTLITRHPKTPSKGIVRAVLLIRNVAVITVSGAALAGAPGVAAKVFEIIARNNAGALMVSQGSSEAAISLAIPGYNMERVVNALEMSLLGAGIVREINFEDNVCIVALVGAGMKGTPGVAARIFRAVADRSVNIRMIAQGSSELNVSFIVKEADGDTAIRALHEEFELRKF